MKHLSKKEYAEIVDALSVCTMTVTGNIDCSGGSKLPPPPPPPAARSLFVTGNVDCSGGFRIVGHLASKTVITDYR